MKTIVSSGQLVLYKESVSVSAKVDEGHGCFAHVASADVIK